MEHLNEKEGSVTFGWVGSSVFFSKFVGRLSAGMGASHLQALQAALEASAGVRYFSDSSELTSYDLLARSAFVRLVLSNRKRFSELVVLNWAGGLSPTSQALMATVGEPLVVLEDRAEFVRRLAAAAPRAVHLMTERRVPTVAQPDPGPVPQTGPDRVRRG